MNDTPQASGSTQPTLICLPALASDALATVLANLREALPGVPLLIAVPGATPAPGTGDSATILPYPPATNISASWIPTAADYLAAAILARDHGVAAILILGSEAQTVPAASIRALHAALAAGHDLVLPRFTVGAHQAMLNAGLLYPLSRALFSQHARYPLPVDLALSPGMADRLAAAAQRFTANNQPDAFLWPVSEAVVAGRTVEEVPVALRTFPQPPTDDIGALLASIAGAFFADIEAKAAFWQRARLTPLVPRPSPAPEAEPTSPPRDPAPEFAAEIDSQIQAFRNAYTNLRELWSLVLPPNSLLALKKLSLAAPTAFRMPDALWARTVYDFVLAYRLRTINRGHLLGAFTPLYFAWVASHLLATGNDALRAETHIDALATAFENEKPYLVARWRWPDRFNP